MSDKTNAAAAKDEQVVKHMLELRDLIKATKERQDEELAPIKARYARGEAYLTNRIEELGHEKFSTTSGTVFTTQRVSASVKDKGAFRGWIEETGEIDLMEVRISTTALKEYMERTGGDAPPGVNVSTMRTLNLRKK